MGKKLIEVALPLDEINAAAAREKSIRHGHPSTLHLWWARRPLAAARAVLFSSIVDDPSSEDYRWPDGDTRARSDEEITAERERLHDLIKELVKWENSNNEQVIGAAQAEIMRATDGNPPPVMDPFAGGGSIPLEAQRLGLEAHASDLNPVAVLINKAMIEIPPKFAGKAPVNPADRDKGLGTQWKGAAGLAADVRSYGKWMRDEAEKRIGHLYPKVQLPPEQGGGEATVIAWLWARTVKCPNPACGAQMPLISSFWLSKKAKREFWIEPVIDGKEVSYLIRAGKGTPEEDTVNRKGGRCIVCGTSVPFAHVRAEGKAGRMSEQLMATVAEGTGGRAYVAANEQQADLARSANPAWMPDAQLPSNPRDFKTPNYGMTSFGDLFTPRQLVALTTFSDLVGEARERVHADALAAGWSDDGVGIEAGGTGATAYADAVATYLAFLVSKQSDLGNALNRWEPVAQCPRQLFGRQAIPMVWDFAEGNPLGNSSGSWSVLLRNLEGVLASPLMDHHRDIAGEAFQADATLGKYGSEPALISTDPPYYDNIGYADLSDFFYVWLRRSLHDQYPELLRTLLVPKNDELVATPYRFEGGKPAAEEFFEQGLNSTFSQMIRKSAPDFPVTVYYAFKQAENDNSESDTRASTGWETMLDGLISSGFSITGTWPMRTEMATRMIGRGTNALASSIVLACRHRSASAGSVSRSDFLRRLRRELPHDLRIMQQASIAPVDLAQAAIGPGMRIFSEYAGVLESDGSKMRVRTALQLINQVLDETLSEQDSEYDTETGWAVAWFEQFGMKEAEFGRADDLSRARNVSTDRLREVGIIRSGRGKVQLIPRPEMPNKDNPEQDRHLTDWEIVQYLIAAIEDGRGYEEAARLKRAFGSRADIAKDLAYRLYTICERKGWAQDALSYNALVVSWNGIESAERESAQISQAPSQTRLI